MDDPGNLDEKLGTFERRDDRLDLRFERRYPHAIETVWSALTEPERLADWMGVSQVEPRVGGRFDTMIGGPQPMTGRILVWEPPHVLELAWNNADAPGTTVRYELNRDGQGARLVFTHRGIPYARSGLMMPGWHFFLSRLGSLLDGAAKPQSRHPWRELQGIYVAHYRLEGVLLDIPAKPA